MQTILNVGGGAAPFTPTIDGDKPTVPQPIGKNSFNFLALNNDIQTVFHFDHIESQPGYRGRGTFNGKEGTLIHKLLAGPPTYTALSIPMDSRVRSLEKVNKQGRHCRCRRLPNCFTEDSARTHG